MKFSSHFALVLVTLTASNSFAATLSCKGTHGNKGGGTLVVSGRELTFSGTQIDREAGINKHIHCRAGQSEQRENPAKYQASGSCDVFTDALLFDSGVLMLVDGRKVEEPEVSATYFCSN
jgi:hypothetical protein